MSAGIPKQVGIDRVNKALAAIGIKKLERPICSRDPLAVKLLALLKTEDKTPGNSGIQLPVILRCDLGIQLFTTLGAPNAHVASHSHDGDGVHFVASGSIAFQGYDLSTGDWIFVPEAATYEFTYGPQGGVTIQCHCCCCK